MPRAFDITASTSNVTLDASGHGEVSFTVSNALRLGVHVRATARTVGGARPEWLSFPEGMERTLSPDGTAVIPVRISVPPDTPQGAYSFSVVVASVANPDEHYAQGPAVAFSVKEAAPAPAKKAFPWWLVALVGGVVLIAGVVVAILASGGGGEAPGLGQACAEEEPRCAADLVCQENVCLGGVGFQGCERGEQCITSRCEGGRCEERVALGETCDSEDDCREPLTCHETFCLMPVGERCTHPSQCVSGNCSRNVCRPPVATCPGRCPRGTICVDGRCQRPLIFKDPRILRDLKIQPITPNP